VSAPLAPLVDGLPGLLYRCRNDDVYTTEFVSEGVAGLTGYPAAAFREGRRQFGELIHPEDSALVREKIGAALQANQPFELTYRIRHASGATRWMWEKGRGVLDRRGRVVALEGFVTDVDERKQGHEALRESEQRLRTIIAAEPECVKVVSAQGALLEMNPAGLAMLEADSLAAVQARPLLDHLLPEYRAAFVALHQRVMGGGSGTLAFEMAGLRGGRRWLETHAVPLRSADGKVSSVLGITRDITERRRAELALRESNERLRMLIESSPLAIYTRDREGLLTSWNPAAEKIYGWKAEEVLGKLLPSVPDAARAESDELRRRLLAGETFINREVERRRRDGSVIHIDAFVGPLRDGAGATSGIIAVVADVSERRRAQQALRESEERFRSLTALSADWYWEQDEHFRFVEAGGDAHSPVRADGIGRTRWEAPGANLSAAQWAAHRALLEQHLAFRDFEYGRLSRDGVWRYISVSGEPIFDAMGAFRGYRGTARDITARKAAEARIRRLNRVYAVLSGINGLIVRATDRAELYREACRIAVEEGGFPVAWIGEVDCAAMQVRPVAAHGVSDQFFSGIRMTLRDDAPEGRGVVGQAVRERAPVIANDAVRDPRILVKGSTPGDTGSLVVLPLLVGGEARGVLVLHAESPGFFDDDEMKLLNELAGDIAFALDHIDKAERVNYLAYYDSLTGLANATLFHERFSQYVRSAQRDQAKLALLLIDIERFKTINDSLGRQAGDALLQEIAARLGRAVDAGAVARLGADHFAIVLPRIKGRSQTVRSFERIARECFSAPFLIAGTELRVSARAGIALYPNDGADAHALFANAEAALGEAQQSGERYCFHTRKLTAGAGAQLALENQLRRALENDEFVLHYQPKFDSETQAIAGLEALIRWQSPARGLVPPKDFIPLLEETGLILEVGSWALRRAALDHRAWTERGLNPPRIAVNLSPIQLRQRDFVAMVEQAIMEGVAPVGIDLEVTESVIMEDIEGNKEKLRRVRDLGIRVAIDDFGTGYSSLAYLAALPVQALKIDRSFIVAMKDDANAMTLVSTIISLAHSLRLKVVAEGVETEEQARYLRLLRCDEMQGYLFSRPLPEAKLLELLRNRAP
jgi:diguanylate cyclase (GGDEF)-like protein/PAS domain S-box-containing protein